MNNSLSQSTRKWSTRIRYPETNTAYTVSSMIRENRVDFLTLFISAPFEVLSRRSSRDLASVVKLELDLPSYQTKRASRLPSMTRPNGRQMLSAGFNPAARQPEYASAM